MLVASWPTAKLPKVVTACLRDPLIRYLAQTVGRGLALVFGVIFGIVQASFPITDVISVLLKQI